MRGLADAGRDGERAAEGPLGDARARRLRQRPLEHARRARGGRRARRAAGASSADEAVALGPQGLGVGAARGTASRALTASEGIRVRWEPGSPIVSPGRRPDFR